MEHRVCACWGSLDHLVLSPTTTFFPLPLAGTINLGHFILSSALLGSELTREELEGGERELEASFRPCCFFYACDPQGSPPFCKGSPHRFFAAQPPEAQNGRALLTHSLRDRPKIPQDLHLSLCLVWVYVPPCIILAVPLQPLTCPLIHPLAVSVLRMTTGTMRTSLESPCERMK